jgi:hypothetical protein
MQPDTSASKLSLITHDKHRPLGRVPLYLAIEPFASVEL